jgi:hypothetical protein
MKCVEMMPQQLLLSSILGEVESIQVYRRVIIFIFIKINPSLPKFAYELPIPKRGVINQKFILLLVLLISGHIMSQFKTEQKLDGF